MALRIGPRMAKECRKAGREVISMEDIPFPAGTHVSMAFEATKNDPSIHAPPKYEERPPASDYFKIGL